MTDPLALSDVKVNEFCSGQRWECTDLELLARLIAIVALGQAAKAAQILTDSIAPLPEAFTDDDLIEEAITTLTASTAAGGRGYPIWQRDGFIFEVISWIAAVRQSGGKGVLKDPHIRATTQGLDGLYIELKPDRSGLLKTIIFEDKCSSDPRQIFASKVMRGFQERHSKKRNAELVSTASVLLRMASVTTSEASRISGDVINLDIRHYRAAMAIVSSLDSEAERAHIFERFVDLAGLRQDQRIGCVFVTGADLRAWFESLAVLAIGFLTNRKTGAASV